MNRFRIYSYLLILFVVLFRISIDGLVGLGDSEAYYWTWSQHLDLSYFDHPPAVAYVIAFFTWLAGNSEFAVRLGSTLFFTLTLIFLHKLSFNIFKNEKISFYTLLLFNITPVFFMGSIQMVPDVIMGFFWLAFLVVLYKIIDSENLAETKKWMWYVLGFILGFAFLSKYFAVLLIPSVCFLLLHKNNREWFIRKEPYLSLLIAFIVISPVLLWNIPHEFASFKFHLVSRHSDSGFSLENLFMFLGGQILYYSPLLFILYIRSLYLCWTRGIKRGDQAYNFLFWVGFPTLIFFYVISLWSNESEPHWPAMGYIPAIIALAVLFVEHQENKEKFKRRFLLFINISLVFAILSLFIFFIHLFYPIIPIDNPKHDIVNELYGWHDVGKKIDEIYQEMSETDEVFVFAYHWTMASQLTYATENRYPVYRLSHRKDQFDFWQNESSLIGKNGIYVGDNRYNSDPQKRFRCQQWERLPDIKIYRGGRVVRIFYFSKCLQYQGQY